MIIRAGAPVTVCMAIFISYLSVADFRFGTVKVVVPLPWRSVRGRAWLRSARSSAHRMGRLVGLSSCGVGVQPGGHRRNGTGRVTSRVVIHRASILVARSLRRRRRGSMQVTPPLEVKPVV